MELTVTQAQAIYDLLTTGEKTSSHEDVITAVATALLETIENVKKTGDEYDLEATIVPDEEDESDDQRDSAPEKGR